MTWDYIVSQGIDLHVAERIDEASAERQKKTAWEILRRLSEHPGLVLADEVGMGKTFVALTVGVSIALQNPDAGPVVVMVPPSVKDKWPRDFGVFAEKCMNPLARERVRAATETVESGVELLKLLDDPPEQRKNIVFLTHGALSRGLTDVWVKLALIRHVFSRRRRLSEVRDAFPRFAGRILRRQNIADSTWENLLSTPPHEWRRVLTRDGYASEDDPVPEALLHGIEDLPAEVLDRMADSLAEMPVRESTYIDERVKHARDGLKEAFDSIWTTWLSTSCKKVRLPLLILDEAHHLKNSSTQLASLFHESDESRESQEMIAGPLNGVFERMLFLTATPFQLGHDELLRVLERFENIAWDSPHAPSRIRAAFRADLDTLKKRLDEAQMAALGLERAWGRLTPEHIVNELGAPMPVEDWWEALQAQESPPEGLAGDVIQHYRATEAAMRTTEAQLRPWVIRHLKPRRLSEQGVERRRVLPGAAITDKASIGGIEIEGEALLPFLLTARAQATLAASREGRALFAEGLASSFEAYRETRAQAAELDEAEVQQQGSAPASSEVDWYLARIEEALPRERAEASAAHPKVRATVERTMRLWEQGEKVLVFCHYRATGKALERHLSKALDEAISRIAAKRFGLNEEQAPLRLQRLGERFNKTDESLRREADNILHALVRGVGGFTPGEEDEVVDVMRRFLRTPSFLARFFPASDEPGSVATALEEKDASGLALRQRFVKFCEFLTKRSTADERQRYLEALMKLQTGERYGREDLDGHEGQDTAKLLPNVRLANGSTKDDTRRRLLLAFNTPFYPEVLVASSVLAEGVDLHLDCRFVIHHDLCWNPSTLEQRTGRIDRLGAKADQAGAPIHVYLPYVAETQDEKMFRVVMDRERWFQVVMGEKFGVESEAAAEKAAARVPLPTRAAEALAFRLEVQS